MGQKSVLRWTFLKCDSEIKKFNNNILSKDSEEYK